MAELRPKREALVGAGIIATVFVLDGLRRLIRPKTSPPMLDGGWAELVLRPENTTQPDTTPLTTETGQSSNTPPNGAV